MVHVIAWRNIWRNRNRSLVVIGAIALGIWALIFAVGFSNGFTLNYLNNAVTAEYSHIQIHHPSFRQDRDAALPVPNADSIARQLRALPEISAVSARALVTGMVASSKTASGIVIAGIAPEHEALLTRLDIAIKDGDYFQEGTRNPVLISKKLADKLGVRTKSKIVLTFQNSTGDITSAAFRIAGIFQSASPKINEGRIYVKMSDLNSAMQTGMAANEIALMLRDPDIIPRIQQYIRQEHPDLLAESWKELAPELNLLVEQSGLTQVILLSIIMTALAFSIVNTMLMAVLERIRELGMLMAVGMNRVKVFFMILLETVLLSVVGCPIGLLLGYLTMAWLGSTGVEFSTHAAGLESFGYSPIVYPYLEFSSYVLYTVGVLITAVIGSLYPAVRAVRLKPVQAIRTL